MIRAENLSKEFHIYRKEPGFLGSVRSLFARRYEINQAVRNFSLSIEPGEIIGLLGPNGAGKTTLMKMFTGIIVPTSGNLEVLGNDPWGRSLSFRKRIALVMGQKSQLWWDIPAMDSLRLLKAYYEVNDQDFQQRVGELSEILEVGNLLHVQVRKLSLGERMKLELMSCLLHRPDVIFLDEPTIGLDLIAQKGIRAFLKEYHRKYNPTIILTSHYMADVAALCSHIVLILGGEKRYDGSITDFEKILGREKIVTFQFSAPVAEDAACISDYDPLFSGGGMEVEIKIPEKKLRDVSKEILQRYPVIDFHTEKIPIERVMETLWSNPELLPSSES